MQAQQLWQAVLGDLQVRLSKSAFDNWLRQTRIVGFEDDVVTVGAANTFGAATLQARYAGQIERALTELVGRPIRARFTVADGRRDGETTENGTLLGGSSSRPPTAPEVPAPEAAPPTNPARAERVPPARRPAGPPSTSQLALSPTPTHGLNPRYVYENYVVGGSNRFAHAASLSVAEQPGGKFNPFFVYGGVGLGKTHLLHAIGHRALELRPGLTVVYVSSEKFTNDLINAIRGQRMEEFRARYRGIDILIIDDIQFIAGKESTQEEFFHTFNTLYQAGKHVVITSDKPPKAIAALEDRLRSRFEGGLIADVGLPDYEMRTAILRTKGEELGVTLPSEVVEYVAQKDQTNIRELEGALNKVLAYVELTGRPLNLQLAMEALTDTAAVSRRGQATPPAVVDAVARHYKVSPKDLRGRVRTKEIVVPRQVAMYLIREETGISLAAIGQELGGKDHTTVMHGIEKIERELTTDPGLRQQLMAIRETLFTAGA